MISHSPRTIHLRNAGDDSATLTSVHFPSPYPLCNMMSALSLSFPGLSSRLVSVQTRQVNSQSCLCLCCTCTLFLASGLGPVGESRCDNQYRDLRYSFYLHFFSEDKPAVISIISSAQLHPGPVLHAKRHTGMSHGCHRRSKATRYHRRDTTVSIDWTSRQGQVNMSQCPLDKIPKSIRSLCNSPSHNAAARPATARPSRNCNPACVALHLPTSGATG